jgi:hypothetical protein
LRSTDEHDAVLYWENIATTRRYVRYTSEIEKRIILKTRFLALKPTTALDIGKEGSLDIEPDNPMARSRGYYGAV